MNKNREPSVVLRRPIFKRREDGVAKIVWVLRCGVGGLTFTLENRRIVAASSYTKNEALKAWWYQGMARSMPACMSNCGA